MWYWENYEKIIRNKGENTVNSCIVSHIMIFEVTFWYTVAIVRYKVAITRFKGRDSQLWDDKSN